MSVNSVWIRNNIKSIANGDEDKWFILQMEKPHVWMSELFRIANKNKVVEDILHHMEDEYMEYCNAFRKGVKASDLDSFVNLYKKKHNNKECLSFLKLTEDGKGKLFRDVSDKCDVVSVLSENKKSDMTSSYNRHVMIINSLIESCNSIPKTFLDKVDKHKPPSNGWSKNALKKVIDSCDKTLISRLKSYYNIPKESKSIDIYNFINGGIMSLPRYRIAKINYEKSPSTKQSETGIELDLWQKDMIKCATEGKSAIVQGPTSGGKTYASIGVMNVCMTTISSFTHTNTPTLAFVLPNFYLAIQTFSTIQNTFKIKNLSLVTKGIQEIRSFGEEGLNVVVGTPKELWTLFSRTDMTLDTLIIDEIHMIGIDGTPIEEKQSICNLISICTGQLFGLSATIHSHSLNELKLYIEKNSRISNGRVEVISYGERPIPLISSRFDGNRFVPTENEKCGLVDVNPVTTITALLELKRIGLVPSLIFDETNDICFDNYKNLVEYLEGEEMTHFKEWRYFISDIIPIAESYNSDSRHAYRAFDLAYQRNNERSKSNLFPSVGAALSDKTSSLDRIISEITLCISRSINENSCKYGRDMLPNEYSTLKSMKLTCKVPLKGSRISMDTIQLIDQYLIYMNMWNRLPMSKSPCSLDPKHIEPIRVTDQTVSPHLVIGNTSGSKYLIELLNKDPNNKNFKNINEMCLAERCTFDSLRPLLKILAKGLSFGLGLLIEHIPYTIQMNIMSLLKTKKIEVIFASQSMRMGINYPIKSCLIRSGAMKKIDTCALMQMGGRAGRRRYDTEGHCIYWNVENDMEVNSDSLEKLSLPSVNVDHGFYMLSPDKCVCRVNTIASAANSLNSLSKVAMKLDAAMKNIEQTISRYNLHDDPGVEMEEDDWDDEHLTTTKDVDSEEIERNLNDIVLDQLSSVINVLMSNSNAKINMSDINDSVDIMEMIISNQSFTIPNHTTSYNITTNMNMICNHMQELYMMHRCNNVKIALESLQTIFEIIHQCKYRILASGYKY